MYQGAISVTSADAMPPAPRSRKRRRRNRPRSRTLSLRDLRRDAIVARANEDSVTVVRPRIWQDCEDAGLGTQDSPCPFVGCKHNLYLSVNPESGSIQMTFPDLEPWEMKHSCSLRESKRGGMPLEAVGERTNVTRERARQIELTGLVKLKLRVPRPDGSAGPEDPATERQPSLVAGGRSPISGARLYLPTRDGYDD